MDKREKVISDLEEQLAWIRDNDFHKFPGWGHTVLAMRDALELLTAQEPRVMTVEEVVGNIVLERGVMLWFEFNDSIKELSAKDIEYNDYLCDDDMPTLYEPNLKWRDNGYLDGVIVAEYNDVFRCWTSRPTDAQMEAVKWE